MEEQNEHRLRAETAQTALLLEIEQLQRENAELRERLDQIPTLLAGMRI
jgi:hypothetical protein